MKLLHQGNQKLKLSFRQPLDFPIHLHNAMEIVLLTAGQSTVIYGGQRLPLAAGDLFIAFPNQVHGYENSENTERYMLIVPATPYLDAFRGTLEQKQPVYPILSRQQWEKAGIQTLLDMALTDISACDHKVMQGYVLVLLGKLLPLLELTAAEPGDTDAVRELLLFLNDHYTEPLSRQDIARTVGYNESYISHIFSDTLHTTLTDYITALRLDDARRLLTDTTLTVSQIALSLGFGSIRSFNRVFSRQVGITPTAYRKNNC